MGDEYPNNNAEKLRNSNEQLSLQIMYLSTALRERSKLDKEWFEFLKSQNKCLQDEISRQNRLIEAQNWILVKSLLGGSFGGLGLSLIVVIILKVVGVF